MLFRNSAHAAVSFLVCLGISGCGADGNSGRIPQSETPADHQNFAEFFHESGTRRNIPLGLLEAISYVETRWHSAEQDNHDKDSDHRHVYGIMGLHSDAALGHSLNEAAKAIGKPPAELIASPQLNIDGAAALIAAIAKKQGVRSSNLSAWSEVVRTFSGIPQLEDSDGYLQEVYKILRDGVNQKGIVIPAHPGIVMPKPKAIPATGGGSGDQSTPVLVKPPMTWSPSPNFTKNGIGKPKYIVVHVTQGSFNGAVSWLKNPASGVSAHYVIQSSTGTIKQLVNDEDRAWHAKCWNSQAIGIEHEGFVDRPEKYFTDVMYNSSANLVKYLAAKYSIPKSNLWIVGHNLGDSDLIRQTGLADCNTHNDPGPGWNWTKYLGLTVGKL